MGYSKISLTLTALLILPTTPVRAADTLYGVTKASPAGAVDVVRIDTSTGQAMTIRTINIGIGSTIGALAYQPQTGKLVAKAVIAGANSLIWIDPATPQTSAVSVVGLSGSSPRISGLEYETTANRLLLSYADNGSNFEDRVAEVAVTGAVLNSTVGFTSDMDALGYRAVSGTLLGFDLNAVTNKRIFTISGLFGSPVTNTIGSPPQRENVGDVALEPSSGVVYVSGYDAAGGFLVRIDSDTTYFDLGPYFSPAQIVGIAFGPDVATVEPGMRYCFGDSNSGTPCPCSNDNDSSVPGSGCANGVFPSGAQLTGGGIASVTNDTLVLATTHLEPSNSGLYFQAENDLSPGIVWGDGLQCAGATLIRLGVRFSDANGYSDTSGFPYTISAKAGNITAGVTKYYQCWYRNPLNSPCGSEFNSSNGYAITWLP